jgi:hypothetical protein
MYIPLSLFEFDVMVDEDDACDLGCDGGITHCGHIDGITSQFVGP